MERNQVALWTLLGCGLWFVLLAGASGGRDGPTLAAAFCFLPPALLAGGVLLKDWVARRPPSTTQA